MERIVIKEKVDQIYSNVWLWTKSEITHTIIILIQRAQKVIW